MQRKIDFRIQSYFIMIKLNHDHKYTYKNFKFDT